MQNQNETEIKIIIEQEIKELEKMQEYIDGVVGEIHEFPLHLPPWKRKRLF